MLTVGAVLWRKPGPARGDELLRQVGRLLAQMVRKGDFVARLGGDEFAVLLEGPSADGARMLAERLIHAVSQPLLPEHPAHRIGASVGIALYPEDATEPQALLSRADNAMYGAKRAGKGQVRAYSPAP